MKKKISKLSMLCDSMIVIRQVRKAQGSTNSYLPPILQRIVLISMPFEQIELYHVLKHLNSNTDSLTNHGAMMEQGMLEIDQRMVAISHIP